MLPSNRRRQSEFAAREAAGESLWTEQFEKAARVRLSEMWRLADEHLDPAWDSYAFGNHIGRILRASGGWQVASYVDPDLLKNASPELVQDTLAAVASAVGKFGSEEYLEGFLTAVNNVLREHRIAYKFVERELIPFSSDELLQEAVEPALRLLVGPQFEAAHGAYIDALREIGNGKAGDAITDAGTALQECLKALGCDGNALGPLIKSAKTKGFIAAHDQGLIAGIEKFLHWASADRSTTGDAHRHSDATVADAWLMVHIVGALIVRLADPSRRDGATE